MDRYDEDAESVVGGWKKCDLAPAPRSSLAGVANVADMAVCIGEVMFQSEGWKRLQHVVAKRHFIAQGITGMLTWWRWR